MPIGPGKYDDLCTKVREETKAEGVLLIVIGGPLAGGFACQAPLEVQLRIPAILRNVADNIERSLAEGKL